MKETTYTRTMRTTCGKTISYLKDPGENAKAHSLTGPAFIYPESEGQDPEYYIYGIRYTKAKWQELVNQHKALLVVDSEELEELV